MGRKTKIVSIEAEGRDKGKRYLITEMSASQAEAWAFRAFGAMARANIQVPEEVLLSGMVGMSALGLKAFLSADWADAQPLLAEMMACVQAMPNPENDAVVRSLIEDDTEETATRARLKDEVFALHTGFSIADSLLTAVQSALRYLMGGATTETLTDESAQLSLHV